MIDQSTRAKIRADAIKAEALFNVIRPLMAGHGPEIQGAALADLVALWIAGHNPDLREDVLREWLATMRKLVPVNEHEQFGQAGFPKHGLS